MMGADEWRYARHARRRLLGQDAGAAPQRPGRRRRASRTPGALAATPPQARARDAPGERSARASRARGGEGSGRGEPAQSVPRPAEARGRCSRAHRSPRTPRWPVRCGSCSRARADTPDYDLWAQVLLVQADGSAVRLGEDIRRARFRNSPFHARAPQARRAGADPLRVQLGGVATAGRCAPARRHRAAELAEVPEELQHRRPYRLRASRGCPDRAHPPAARCAACQPPDRAARRSERETLGPCRDPLLRRPPPHRG